MIQRVNLIASKSFSITQAVLLRTFMVVLVFNVALVGYQYYKISQLKPQIKTAQADLLQLKDEKKLLEKKPVVKRKQAVQVGEYQDLFEVLNAYPKWGLVVEEVSYNLPNSLWLSGITVEIVGQKQAGTTNKKKDKKDKKAQSEKPQSKLTRPNAIKLILTGVSSEIDGLSSFVKNLHSSRYFKRTIIEDSKKQAFGFEFTVTSFIDLDYVE